MKRLLAVLLASCCPNPAAHQPQPPQPTLIETVTVEVKVPDKSCETALDANKRELDNCYDRLFDKPTANTWSDE